MQICIYMQKVLIWIRGCPNNIYNLNFVSERPAQTPFFISTTSSRSPVRQIQYPYFQLRIDRTAIKNATILKVIVIFNQQEMAHRYNRWTDYEDNILTELVEKYGIGHWSTIAKEMKSNYEISKRNGKQCRQRWFNQLDRSNLNQKWTNSEDLRLIHFQAILGTRWIEMVHHFPGRSDNNIKNRFYSIVRKSIRKMCRYVSIKTTSMKVYSIKPSTLSRVFVGAVCEGGEMQLLVGEKAESGVNSRFTTQDYCEITQIIIYFVIDNNNAEPESQPPTKEKATWALNKLMELNNIFQKDSSSDVNSPQSSEESEKKHSECSKNGSIEGEMEEMALQMKEEARNAEDEMHEEIQMEEQTNNNGIFSSKTAKRQQSTKSSIPFVSPSLQTWVEHSNAKDFPEPQLNNLPSFQLARGFSEQSLGSNFVDVNWNAYMAEEIEFQEYEMRLFTTPSKSASDSFFNKYLQ